MTLAVRGYGTSLAVFEQAHQCAFSQTLVVHDCGGIIHALQVYTSDRCFMCERVSLSVCVCVFDSFFNFHMILCYRYTMYANVLIVVTKHLLILTCAK